VAVAYSFTACAQADADKYNLPLGIPREVDTNGNIISIPQRFTTSLYQREALGLVLKEANQIAEELKLNNELPITESNLVEFHISPFGFAYMNRRIGGVTTKNYAYYVSQGNKFSYLIGTHQLEDSESYLAKYTWPVSQISTNIAYKLAIQWLTAIHVDIEALNRDCNVTVAVDDAYVHAPTGKFVPIYFVSWVPKNKESPGAASVRLFAPTKTLLQLRVEDEKYILRKPLIFTNLSDLFPGTAPIFTNRPVKTIYMSSPPPE